MGVVGRSKREVFFSVDHHRATCAAAAFMSQDQRRAASGVHRLAAPDCTVTVQREDLVRGRGAQCARHTTDPPTNLPTMNAFNSSHIAQSSGTALFCWLPAALYKPSVMSAFHLRGQRLKKQLKLDQLRCASLLSLNAGLGAGPC